LESKKDGSHSPCPYNCALIESRVSTPAPSPKDSVAELPEVTTSETSKVPMEFDLQCGLQRPPACPVMESVLFPRIDHDRRVFMVHKQGCGERECGNAGFGLVEYVWVPLSCRLTLAWSVDAQQNLRIEWQIEQWRLPPRYSTQSILVVYLNSWVPSTA
jgi:hypothetical protein